VFGRANLARFRRFHPCSLSLGGLCAASQRRCAYLFQLGLLRPGRRLQAFRETRFFTRHVFNLSFQGDRMDGRQCPAGLPAVREVDPPFLPIISHGPAVVSVRRASKCKPAATSTDTPELATGRRSSTVQNAPRAALRMAGLPWHVRATFRTSRTPGKRTLRIVRPPVNCSGGGS